MRHNLIRARQAKNLTQAQLGNMVGLSKQQISSIEKGRTVGRLDTWDAIAKALDVADTDQRKLREIVKVNSTTIAQDGIKHEKEDGQNGS